MPTSEATVKIERPSRYLTQLCRHAQQMGGRKGHQIPGHLGHRPPAERPQRVEAEWSDTHGTITFDWGTCTVDATDDTLELRIEADDQENVRRIEELIARNLTRFTARDPVSVEWRSKDGSTTTERSRTLHGSQASAGGRKRGRGQAMLIAVTVAVGVAIHVGVGVGLLAMPQWTGMIVDLLLLAVAVKLVFVGVHLYRRRKVARTRS
ncbi:MULTISPECIES: DUF2218 domain-containing protein [unclassified Nonomuraea]|uniref:DUF2218 domain-containing protein n=1 Tax=unclassified Nonomuraea TaxID=2593643 RepID=UPI0033D7490D